MENSKDNGLKMESIGQYLKSVREEKKLTLKKIFEMTKIKIRILQDIENDNFGKLGGFGYAKATITSFARAIGADENKILQQLNKKVNIKQKHISRTKSIQPRKMMIPTNIFAVILLIILIIVLTLIVIKLNKDGILKSPFRKKIKAKIETKKEVEKSEEIEKGQNSQKKEEESSRITDEQNSKKEKEQNSQVTDESEIRDPEEKTSEILALNEAVLNDTTDYIDEYLFKGKESPFNYKE